jgi:hypothetical protein
VTRDPPSAAACASAWIQASPLLRRGRPQGTRSSRTQARDRRWRGYCTLWKSSSDAESAGFHEGGSPGPAPPRRSGRRNAMRLPGPWAASRSPPVRDPASLIMGSAPFPLAPERPPDRSTSVRSSAMPCGFGGKPQPHDAGRSSGDRLGRTVRRGLLPGTAVARASVNAPLLPFVLAVPGLHGQSIARPAPASIASPHRRNGARVVVCDLVPPGRCLASHERVPAEELLRTSGTADARALTLSALRVWATRGL